MDAAFPLDTVRAMPKAELHVHLEGTVDAATVLTLAQRHGLRPPADDVEGVERWFRFDGFPMFLDRYFTVLDLLRDPDDFALAAERYLDIAVAQGVVHVEFHVSATGHVVEHAKRWGPIHDGIVEGCSRAASRSGVSWGLIPDISPHLSAVDCRAAMDEVFAHGTEHLVAIGMGGPADTWTTDDFGAIYATARDHGLPGVSHAAEHGGPDEVRFAVEQFDVVRIQHGIGVMSDPEVVSLLVEGCPVRRVSRIEPGPARGGIGGRPSVAGDARCGHHRHAGNRRSTDVPDESPGRIRTGLAMVRARSGGNHCARPQLDRAQLCGA
ncbi:MAG: hypothetical protein E4H05_10255, partial [Acidimicrobiales bacterium]